MSSEENMRELILASNSPRRKEILSKAGYVFGVKVSRFSEIGYGDPIKTAEQNALGKAEDVFSYEGEKVVLGADTVVFAGGKILGKPADGKAAKDMLEFLSGKTHLVITGYAVIYPGGKVCGHDVSEVTFNVLSEEVINAYVASGSPLDKAGAYGIQDPFPIVAAYSGSINNIIGLPIEKIAPLLDKALKK